MGVAYNMNMGMAYNNTIIMHNYYCITVEVKNAMNRPL